MKRQWKLALCLLMAAVTLSACSGGETNNQTIFPEVTQNLGLPVPTAVPTEVPVQDDSYEDDPYDVQPEYSEVDPLAEENYQVPEELDDSSMAAEPEATVYPYAGSTPIALNPVDMPTPTPHPPINFTYVAYTAGSLGLTFEAPVGWNVDESLTEVYIVSEPVEQMNGDQQCVITISAVPVNTNYDQNDLEKEVKARLNDISATNFAEWEPSLTATRNLMGKKGVYANYSGELVNGIRLGGRIHYVCIDNMVYGVEIMYPREFREDYMNIFDKIRDTLKTI
ncbi:MAG: hypothetical protein E7319_03880 [Clostridiales bacterium]|nr:hypothetical protein [Clostridiales bacterium]